MSAQDYFKREENDPSHPVYLQNLESRIETRLREHNGHDELRRSLAQIDQRIFGREEIVEDEEEHRAKEYHVPKFKNPELHMGGSMYKDLSGSNLTRLPDVVPTTPTGNFKAGEQSCKLLCKTGAFTFKSRSNPFQDFTRNSAGRFDLLEPASFNISRKDLLSLSTDRSVALKEARFLKAPRFNVPSPPGPGVGRYNISNSQASIDLQAPRFSLSSKQELTKGFRDDPAPGPLLPNTAIVKLNPGVIKLKNDESVYKDHPREAFMGQRLGVGPGCYNLRKPYSRGLHEVQKPAYQQ